jgi:hypothetical protein
MPFASRSQLRTCFFKKFTQNSPWDCIEFLNKTKNPLCLPERVGGPRSSKCRPLRKGEEIIGPVMKGKKGGYFFMAKGVKIYIPKKGKTLEKAISLLGKKF